MFFRVPSLNGEVRSESPLLIDGEREILFIGTQLVSSTFIDTQFHSTFMGTQSHLLLLHKSAQLMLKVSLAYSEHLV